MSGNSTNPSSAGDTWEGVWVYTEQRQGQIIEVAYEILGEASRLAKRLHSEVTAVLIGNNVESMAGELVRSGADRVFLADHPGLANYDPDAYATIVTGLVEEHKPQILLVGATSVGRDLAPTVAARLATGLCADCTNLDLDPSDLLLQIAPVFGGKEMATMLCPERRPQMATVRPGVFAKLAPAKRRGEIVNVDPGRGLSSIRSKTRGAFTEKAHHLSLEHAEIVVAGGAGIQGDEGWQLVRHLAEVLGAEVGGTRPPMDAGYLQEDQMIGQSGVTIRPKLYFCIGISGDIQHTVGFERAGTVVAINNDPSAPIFKVADFGIVGDYREVVPKLIEALR